MRVSNREIVLGGVTLAVVALLGTWWLGDPLLREWRQFDATRRMLHLRELRAREALGQRTAVDRRLADLRRRLPQYPPEMDVTSEMLHRLERAAADNTVTLLSRSPDKEKSAGDLYEISIQCSWEADADALIRFLYALQTQAGIIFDIRQINVQPAAPGRLRGNFVLGCAYSRSGTRAAGAHIGAPSGGTRGGRMAR